MCNDLFKYEEKPDVTNRRFFPLQSDLRNHYNKAFAKRKLATIDQEHVSKLVDKWIKQGKDCDHIFFRPYIAGENVTINAHKIETEEDDDVPNIQCQQTLLFVHQMSWQKRLLLRYGQEICLLDATYKTTKYALPLFFLCVKTNVGYQVVASFILQNELRQDIEEALQILQKWNPEWSPSFFMTDKCEAEVNAIENCFSGIKF